VQLQDCVDQLARDDGHVFRHPDAGAGVAHVAEDRSLGG
jgi:hypothetical protein